MQVEESGNMIMMILHWAQLVGSKKAKPFLRAHYKTTRSSQLHSFRQMTLPASLRTRATLL
jgi:hypothetical protein